MVAKRSSRSKSMSKRRSSSKRSSVKRSSVKRRSSSKKRMSNKKKLALGAAGGLAALIAGREMYKRRETVAPKAKSFFESLRARFSRIPPAPPAPPA